MSPEGKNPDNGQMRIDDSALGFKPDPEPPEQEEKPETTNDSAEPLENGEELTEETTTDELQTLIDLVEGGEKVEDGKAHPLLNLRAAVGDYASVTSLAERKDKLDHIRATLTRRIGGAENLPNLKQAYDEIYIPQKQQEVDAEYEKQQEYWDRGAPGGYKGPYEKFRDELTSARAFSEYLGILMEDIPREKEEIQRIEVAEQAKAQQIARLRGERAQRGAELLAGFSLATIAGGKPEKPKVFRLVDYGAKIGHKLLSEDYMPQEEINDAISALSKFQSRLVEIFPETSDRKLLYEEYVELSHKLQRELDGLKRLVLHHEPDEGEMRQIDQKAAEINETEAIIQALRRAI